ncbi:aklavinone 12-hydroxylase RdmE [Streptoalloteichus hindustanus]|uniref:Aklavinone 12-hydroxylase n=1 Tax=Streptoalloteichus hindustanus TaxID=2017 RepID=A0A1M5FL58_STRHI|nr:FAD-dependent oxidoreductase [Streptoalloteichus hindustanus]SHF92260.1 aklavinone 12-hydroxylase [Streptoalloteichus hindustanus]
MGERVSVLVVGAGLAGLASAAFLARRGVDVLLVERRSGTSLFPRAVGQNQRTMELLGFDGIAEDVPSVDPDLATFRVRVAATLPGPTLREESTDTAANLGLLSPAEVGTAGQHELEPLLRQHAEDLGAELRFDTQLVSFSQDDEGVTAVLRGRRDERTSEVRADYLVAADGTRSGVREALGVDRHGRGSLGHNISIIFDADLGELVGLERAALHVLYNEQVQGVFITIDRAVDRHLLSVGYDPARGQSPADFTTERCTELIRMITEMPDLVPEIKAVRPWEMAAAVADRFRVGRVFLAGDAAKVTPPSGGFGGNTAIGDAYDLAWKLAAVLGSSAGPGLLDTYDAERRSIAERVVAEALWLLDGRGPVAASEDGEDVEDVRTFDHQRAVELTLGFRYRSSAVLTEDDDPADAEDPYRPTGRPGFRAPHVWLRRNGDRVSTVDLFGSGFVLLSGVDGGFWAGAAEDVAARLNTAVRVHTVGGELAELTDVDGDFLAKYGIGAAGASLVRPDGVVAWRTTDAPSDPAQALLGALTTVLAR